MTLNRPPLFPKLDSPACDSDDGIQVKAAGAQASKNPAHVHVNMKRYKTWLKPREQSLHPTQETASHFNGLDDGAVEDKVSPFVQSDPRRWSDECFSTPKSRIVSSIRLPRAHDSTDLPSLPPLRSSSIHSRFNDGALHTALRPRSRPRVYSHRDHTSFVRPKILDGGQNS